MLCACCNTGAAVCWAPHGITSQCLLLAVGVATAVPCCVLELLPPPAPTSCLSGFVQTAQCGFRPCPSFHRAPCFLLPAASHLQIVQCGTTLCSCLPAATIPVASCHRVTPASPQCGAAAADAADTPPAAAPAAATAATTAATGATAALCSQPCSCLATAAAAAAAGAALALWPVWAAASPGIWCCAGESWAAG